MPKYISTLAFPPPPLKYKMMQSCNLFSPHVSAVEINLDREQRNGQNTSANAHGEMAELV